MINVWIICHLIYIDAETFKHDVRSTKEKVTSSDPQNHLTWQSVTNRGVTSVIVQNPRVFYIWRDFHWESKPTVQISVQKQFRSKSNIIFNTTRFRSAFIVETLWNKNGKQIQNKGQSGYLKLQRRTTKDLLNV